MTKILIVVRASSLVRVVRYQLEFLEALVSADYKIVIFVPSAADQELRQLCERMAIDRSRHYEFVFERDQADERLFFKRAMVRALACDYLMLAWAYDLWAPDYLERCLQIHESAPDTMIAYSACRFDWMESAPGSSMVYKDEADLSRADVVQRVGELIRTLEYSPAAGGLIRIKGQSRAFLQSLGRSSPGLLPLTAALAGPCRQIEEPLRIMFNPNLSQLFLSRRLSGLRRKAPAPYLSQLRQYIGLGLGAPVEAGEKNELLVQIIRNFLARFRPEIEEDGRRLIDRALNWSPSEIRPDLVDFSFYCDLLPRLTEAADLAPDLPGLHLARAVCYEGLGNRREARESLRRELERDPAFGPAAVFRARWGEEGL